MRSARPVRPVVGLVTVVPPLKRLKVGEVVAAPRCNGPFVVDFPAVPGRSVAVLIALHQRAASVSAEQGMARHGGTLLPHCLHGGVGEVATVSVGVRLSPHPGLHCPAVRRRARGGSSFVYGSMNSNQPPFPRQLQLIVHLSSRNRNVRG